MENTLLSLLRWVVFSLCKNYNQLYLIFYELTWLCVEILL